MNIDEKLAYDLHRLDLKLIQEIFPKETRLRYTLLVEKDNQRFIFKWHHPDILNIFEYPYEKIYAEKLTKEIDYYEKNKNKQYIPKLIYSEKNLILLEYVEGVTLREWLIKYLSSSLNARNQDIPSEEFKEIIQKTVCFLKEYYKCRTNDENLDVENTKNSIKETFYYLMTLGPMDVRDKRIESIIKRGLRIITKRVFRFKIDRFSNLIIEKIPLNRTCLIHGDLNLNNIMLSNVANKVIVLDWENNNQDTILLDLNYFYSMCLELLEGLPRHQEFVANKVDEFISIQHPEIKEAFYEINKLYKIGISINRRFRYNSSLSSFLRNTLLLPIRVMKL